MIYHLRPQERLALAAIDAAAGRGMIRAALLEGPPGCGKTALAEHYAAERGATLVYAMMHAWTDDQELFRGVDVAAAVAGDAARVALPGVISRAATASNGGLVVLCLDELDKAPERVENLLLDVLQSGRVPLRPGEHLRVDVDRLVVFATTNGARPHTDAFLRRVRRVRMQALPVDVLDRIAAERSGAPLPVVRCLSKVARAAAAADEAVLSLQELVQLASDAWAVADSIDDVRELVAQWGARGERGARLAAKGDLAPAWGEIKAERRRSEARAA